MEKMEAAPRFHSPLTLKVGQVMTGFGIGCGVGIGVGRPLNLGSVPVVGQLAGDVSRSFGPVGWQIHNLMKKFGLKNIEVGVGCGIGLGHGFGIGVALKPGSVEQLKHFAEQGVSMLNQRIRSAMGQAPQEEEKPQIVVASGSEAKDEGGRLLHNSSSGSTERLEQVSESKQSYYNEVDKVLERLESENKMMRMLLAHQDQIDEIKRQNQELKEAFEERVHKQLGESEVSRMCFECRRKLRSRK